MEQEKLDEILRKHKEWFESGGKDGEKADLRGADLRGADLSGADLSGADLRGADLRGAILKQTDFIGSYLNDADRGMDFIEANLSAIKIDRKTLDQISDLIREKYEGSWILKDESVIERSIEFPPEYYQAGISILNEFGSVLRKKYPETKAKVRIEQDGLKVTMTVDPVEGDREVIEKELDEYGLVITGKMTPEEYVDNDPLLLIELKSELRSAYNKLETQKEIIQYQNREIKKQDIHIDKLLSLIGLGIQSQPDIININNAKGDLAFAKDQAIAMINKKITEAAKITDSLKDKFNELSTAVENMVRDMPNDKAREVTGDLQTLVSEASKDQPRRKWYEISGEGLTDAAKAVGSLGKPVIDTTQAVLKLLG
ncbi:pentapeptide repeat-containing protein [Desulfobacterales bacterium HSG2]|nr:pentapeptide repeat-containing protein [Desulfobacterales bacterium HSG2]